MDECDKNLVEDIAGLLASFFAFMNFINDLFLKKGPNPTVVVDEKNHVYRNRDAANDLVRAPLVPQLPKDQLTVHHVWRHVARERRMDDVFIHRPLLNVRTVRASLFASSLVLTF